MLINCIIESRRKGPAGTKQCEGLYCLYISKNNEPDRTACPIYYFLLFNDVAVCYNNYVCGKLFIKEEMIMKHVKTLNTRDYKKSMVTGGCGECQTSCQSACKTSCTVGNQSCENKNK